MKVAAALAAVPLLFAVRPYQEIKLLADDSLDGGGQKHDHRHHFLSQGKGLQEEAVRSKESLRVDAGPLPKKLPNCSDSDGVLALSGLYEVTNEMHFPGDCKISTTGAAEVRLSAPIRFEGEVQLLGTVAFKAHTPLPGPCVTMGSCAVHRSSSTSFSGCENNDEVASTRQSDDQASALNILRDLRLMGGSLTFTACRTVNHGGALYVGGNFTQQDGDLRALNVDARWSGGALFVAGSLKMSGGSVVVQNATASTCGGALNIIGMFSMSGGNVTVQNAAAALGGALGAEHADLSGGSLQVYNATAENGGAIHIGETLSMSGGNVTVQNASARRDGGALLVFGGGANLSGGSLQVRNAQAVQNGGALFLSKLSMSGTSITVQNAVAHSRTEGGGALYVKKEANISGGRLRVRDAKAMQYGGALVTASNLSMSGGNITVQNAWARKGGGAVYVRLHASLSNGSLQVRNATAAESGGALYIGRTLSMSGGNITVQNATTRKNGGAVHVHLHANLSGGSLQVRNATAAESGGCLYVGDINKSAASHLFLQRCSADEGGGIRAYEGSAHLSGRTAFDNCTALKTGKAISAAGNIKVEAAWVSGREYVPTMYASHGHIEVAQLDCANAPGCRVAAASQELGSLTCAQGQGRFAEASSTGCATCEVKHTRLASKAEACTPCPNMTKIVCEPDELGLPPGTMVLLDSSLDNLSDWYFCPSKEVCPGGTIQAASDPDSEPKFLEEMCGVGYDGPGCTNCKPAFARPDGNTMRCVECANTTQQAALYVARLMITDLALFASATATVSGAKKERPISSTWLNMLMAFAAVAGIVMSAVMQTGGFARLQESAQTGLEAVQVPVVLFQGGASSPVMSGECLLQLFRFPKELYLVQLMMSILPALLCVILAAAKGFWLALVVTTNVFLPRFVAAFGKYLVSFRVRPADVPGGELHMDFLPALGSQPVAIAIIVSAIACCFVVGIGSWTYVVMSRKQPLQPHVAYLMCAYKTEYGFWEVERLGRKMLMALLTTMIPVTVSPALQMAAISIVLSCSLLLYLIYEPYQVSFWNKTEQRLLLVASVMIGLTSYLIANDLHWAQSDVCQQMLIFLICAMASGTCMVMMFFVGRAFYVERFKASQESAKGQVGTGPA